MKEFDVFRKISFEIDEKAYKLLRKGKKVGLSISSISGNGSFYVTIKQTEAGYKVKLELLHGEAHDTQRFTVKTTNELNDLLGSIFCTTEYLA